MEKNRNERQDGAASASMKYLSTLGAWALSFGCAVGWGCFVMPGTTFLPLAGPLGSVIGLFIGAAIMLIIAVNFSRLMQRYPGSGGAFTYARAVLGGDHGFLCGWLLILTYAAIIWANSTAMSLIIRYLFGDILFFGFSYEIAGYTVYMGEVLLAIFLLALTCLVCAVSKNLSKWIQIIGAILLFGGILACFIAVLIHCGGFSHLTPLFQTDSNPAVQIIGVVILAPWAFIGFESISHSAKEFRFSPKKSLPIMAAAILTGVLSYAMLVICASMAHPDGYTGWSDYIASLMNCEGIQGLPTFYNAQRAMGSTGLTILGISAFCGIITGLIGNMIALSRLCFSFAKNGIFPKPFAIKNKRNVPWGAVCLIGVCSCVIPFLGRTAIGWIVDVTTIGATIVYGYVSMCSFAIGKREHKRSYMVWGVLGFLIALICVGCYLLPNLRPEWNLATESYLILIIWSVLGMVTFRSIIRRDESRYYGKSATVWLVLFALILFLSVSWLYRTTSDEINSVAADLHLENTEIIARIDLFGNHVVRNVFFQLTLILIALIVIFSIFNIIKKREKQIEAARIRAEDANRAKSNFLSNMSHDIRTPMNAITGYTTLALKEENTPDNVREYLEKIDDSSKHLLSLINDILDTSHIESGKMVLHTAPADLCHMLDDVLNIFSLQMKNKNISYSVDYSSVTDRYVICDQTRLDRILLNLISNAYKFTPEGGSITVILLQKGKDGENGVYELSVADTGIGMSPEFKERIFEAFERERTSTVSQVQGTGLGMSITKSFVELMGGTITVESEKGKGTKFIIRLSFPLCDESDCKIPYKTELAETPQSFEGKRLLLVEDNPINREIACEILGQKGFEVETAENGAIAVETIASAEPNRYNAILMDIQMPEMNGYEASKAIRCMEDSRSTIPIIAITANTFEDDRQEALSAGMNAHVSKPFNPEELFSVINEYIR